jgi:hypothetical protein
MIMENINRRSFIRKSGAVTAGTIIGPGLLGRSSNRYSPNNTVRVAVIGIRSRGLEHCHAV